MDNFSVPSSSSVTDQSRLPEFPPALLLEPVEAATENLKDASASVEPASFIEDIAKGGRSCAEEILTESSEVSAQLEARKDEGEQNLELEIAAFLEAMEKICGAIREVLLLEIEQRKRRNRNRGVFFFLVKMGALTLAFFIGVVLVSVLLTALAPEGCLMYIE